HPSPQMADGVLRFGSHRVDLGEIDLRSGLLVIGPESGVDLSAAREQCVAHAADRGPALRRRGLGDGGRLPALKGVNALNLVERRDVGKTRLDRHAAIVSPY